MSTDKRRAGQFIWLVAAMCSVLIALPATSLGAGATRKVAASGNRSLTLTIFADFATVRDVRTLTLAQGINHIGFPNISPQLLPQTVFFTDVASNHPIWVVEQNFDTNLLNAGSLLQSSIGKTVTIIVTNPTTAAQTRERATVISADGPILKFADRIETGVPPFGRIVYPAIPSGLLVQPALEADIGSTAAGSPRVALTYLTNGFAWSADYLMRINANIDRADVDVLATVTNGSGTGFENAALQLVSGDVQRVSAENYSSPRALGAVSVRAEASMVAPVPPSRQALLEFYLYTLPRTTTLADKQTKQFSLLTAQGIPLVQSFEVDAGGAEAYTSAGGSESTPSVYTYVQFKNQGPGGLGVPLPSGVVHIYKSEDSGNAEFVGEDAIGRTPKLATVRLGLGQTYDIKAHTIQAEFHQVISPNNGPTYDFSSHRISLTNARSKAVAVKVFEELPSEWAILSENVPHTKLSSSQIEWVVNVPALGSATIEYTVRVKQE